MKRQLTIQEFLEKRRTIPVIDVRTPAEFVQGHISGAHNVPLFSNHERVVVGTLYKQQGRDLAILQGLEYVGPRMRSIVENARSFIPGNEVIVHCWRGGMRSASVAWLLETTGTKAHTLIHGYKAYRRLAQEYFARPYPLLVLGGKTGSGKTDILKCIASLGEQVIDLETIAHHKGSAFGAIGELPQTSNEQFENNMFEHLLDIDPALPLWVEDESKAIGKNFIPQVLFQRMKDAQVIFIDIPKNVRVERLVKEYATCGPQVLIDAMRNIERRLGGQNLKQAIEAIERLDYHTAADISLAYYDKAYLNGIHNREPSRIHTLPLHTDNPSDNAQEIIEFSKQKRLWNKP